MKAFFSLLLWLVVLTGIYWLFAAGGLQSLRDEYFLATYHPTAEVAALASEDGFKSKGLTLFYESNPQIVDSATIQQHCPSGSDIEVFGCYDGNTIYVLNITNPELRSQMGTAAAHEMLHAAYARLSSSAKKTVNSEVEKAESSCAQTPGLNLEARMSDYSQSEPGQRDNELHSILGTECLGVGTDLEAYYGQYFTNRASTVALSTQYNQVFLSARQALENDKQDYFTCIAGLNADQRQIQQLESQMNADRASGNVSAYNALVDQHNSLVDAYNSERNNCLSLQTRYNSAVDQYNALIGSQ